MTDLNRTIPTIVEYAAGLSANGKTILRTSGGTFWIGYETGAKMRLPTFSVAPVSADEVREALWSGRTALVTYLLEADELHIANSYLYICTDHTYSLDKLTPKVRRNVKRGLREFKIEPVDSDQLLAHGFQAFCDTRRRNGVNDGTRETFFRRFTLRARCKGHVFLGAWKNGELGAFLSIAEVDDWAEIEGTFSMNSLLQFKPNDAIVFYALSHYLTERRFRLVSHGLSSLQAVSKAGGLHAFKTKMGFVAKPVHRVFEVRQLLRPFINAATVWAVRKALCIAPQDPRLKKAEGILACMRGEDRLIPLVEEGSVNE